MKPIHFSLYLILGLLVDTCWGQTAYRLTDLGAIIGPNSYAQGINNQGQVVGFWETTNGTRAFLFQEGIVVDLGPAGGNGGSHNYALSINQAGQVVGYTETTNGARAFIYQNGTSSDLADLTELDSYAFGVNQSGQIIGHVMTSAGAEAFLYSSGHAIGLGTLGGTNTFAYAINHSLQVAGASFLADNETLHAFSWQGGVISDLNQNQAFNGGWVLAQAHGINDFGSIVGWGMINNQEHAFLYNSGGRVTDLGVLPGGTNSYALGVNNSNQVVGASAMGSGNHAVVWLGGQLQDLNQVIDASGWELREACGINDLGQIVGWGTINGQTHACLLTPLKVAILAGDGLVPTALDKSGLRTTKNMGGTEQIKSLATASQTNTWFVSQSGNNGYNGQAAAWSSGVTGPFKTINQALSQPLAGDVVNIAAGTYSENVDLRGKPVQIRLQGLVVLH